MTQKQYDRVAKALLEHAQNIERAKRPGYTVGSADVLHNFKAVAERVGLSPMQVWAVYFLKHIDALTAFAKDTSIPQAEPIESRFADAINYLKLGFALSVEGPPAKFELDLSKSYPAKCVKCGKECAEGTPDYQAAVLSGSCVSCINGMATHG